MTNQRKITLQPKLLKIIPPSIFQCINGPKSELSILPLKLLTFINVQTGLVKLYVKKVQFQPRNWQHKLMFQAHLLVFVGLALCVYITLSCNTLYTISFFIYFFVFYRNKSLFHHICYGLSTRDKVNSQYISGMQTSPYKQRRSL